jgi:alcohol dehydrogenase class IV
MCSRHYACMFIDEKKVIIRHPVLLVIVTTAGSCTESEVSPRAVIDDYKHGALIWVSFGHLCVAACMHDLSCFMYICS